LAGKICWIKERYAVDADLAGKEAGPERFNTVADRRDDSQAGHHNPPLGPGLIHLSR
jgi:hypothetical protein